MSEAAIQKVLVIQELVELIVVCTFVRSVPGEPVRSCQTVLALARVNKYFSEIALGQLWSSLDSIQHLLMPWKAPKKPISKPRLPRPKDLNRYVYYSRFVQVLNIYEEPLPLIRALERVDYLAVEFDLNDQLYPHLKKLLIQSERFGDWACYLKLRTGPVTQNLLLSLNPDLPNLVTVKDIGKRCANISTFKLSPAMTSRALFREVIRPALADMSKLEMFKVHLEACGLVDLLETITALPTLRFIHLEISGGAILEPTNGSKYPKTDRRLRLDCETPNPRYFPTILRLSAQFSILYSTIKLVRDPNAKEEQLRAAISSLIQHQPEAQDIYFCDRARPQITKESNMFLSVRTLMVTPELLNALSSSAPLLKVCHLSPYRLPRSNQHMKAKEFLVTLQDIVNFLNRCLRIWDVGIGFDGRKPKIVVTNILPASKSSAAHIHVGGSSIDDVEYVGSILSSLPRLGMAVVMPPDYVVPTLLPTEEEQELWLRVNREYLVHRQCGCNASHVE
ncbi:hypothetical protein M408DRAFT_329554 [Serendipita vermifera MAFF 305830]|uniref:Uncharacterized protein n=1 Tax=Serendipita vermifera MAFF 305830 TaxID=933852 RepID=A0A0C3B7U1_SERVB|nr:hypothetical protein M408DRAFT_329554 [Serendipita vermifera MAFF 305830]